MATTNINLLPWREERRKKRQQQLLNVVIVSWVFAGLISYGLVYFWNDKIAHQNNRNSYLDSEIAALTKTIKEIEDLKDKRNAIVDRVEVIQELQSNRTQIVHIFDDLVYKMPEGVFLESLQKTGNQISMRGFAQANARVSALMRNLDSSEWFTNPTLKVVQNKENAGLELSQFNLQVLEEREEK